MWGKKKEAASVERARGVIAVTRRAVRVWSPFIPRLGRTPKGGIFGRRRCRHLAAVESPSKEQSLFDKEAPFICFGEEKEEGEARGVEKKIPRRFASPRSTRRTQ